MTHGVFVDETTPTARALLVLEMVQNSPGIRGEQLADRLGFLLWTMGDPAFQPAPAVSAAAAAPASAPAH